jgi:Myotubularin-like phosphatase domain
MSGSGENVEVAGTVDVSDDALQELINEAQSLMAGFDQEAGVVFSIDSDEEDNKVDAVESSAPSNATKPVTEDHPLSMAHLATSPAPSSLPVGAPTSLMNGGSTGMTQFFSNGTSDQVNQNVVAGMDQFKYQTSWLASGIASMAQRAASQVAAAAAPVHVANGPTPQPAFGNAYPAQIQATTRTPPVTRATGGFAKSAVEMDKELQAKLIKDNVGNLLPGERIIMFLGNLLHVGDTSGLSYLTSQSSDAYMWCCAMSFYRLILFSTAPSEKLEAAKPDDWNALCWPSSPAATTMIEIPLASIDRVEKTVYQAVGSSFMGIIVHCKDCGRVVRFTTPNYADTGRAYDSLNTYAFPGRRNLGYLFAFESKRQEVMASVQVDAATGQQSITLPPTPKRFDPVTEYPRLLNKTSITNVPWTLWATLNSTYNLSPTYPSVLVGPATLDETKPESQHVIHQCAAFRSEQRLPAMSWCGQGGASIWRASQPKVGLQGNRSPADELFLRHIAESARGANAMADPGPIYPRAILQQLTGDYGRDWVPEPGCGLKILDLRPRASAMANRTGGMSMRFGGITFVRINMFTHNFIHAMSAPRLWIRKHVVLQQFNNTILQYWQHSHRARLLPEVVPRV